MKTGIKKSRGKIIFLIIFSFLLVVLIMFRYFFPSFYHETYRGVEYYKTESYVDFGIGFNRYGKIASKYLPRYNDICENAQYLDFYYKDSSFGIHKYVIIAVGVRYESDIYSSKRDEILQIGTDFGEDYIVNNRDFRHYRLIETKSRINGEKLSYVVGCSDTDNAIMYFVYIDSDDYKDNVYWIFDDTSLIHTTFWQELHNKTAQNEGLEPKIS